MKTTTKLTAKEAAVLRAIRSSEYHDGDPLCSVWSYMLDVPEGATKRSMGGILASLSKKGLVSMDGEGSEATVRFTAAGFELLGSLG